MFYMYRSTPEILRFHPLPLFIFPLQSLYKWLKYEKTKPIEILRVDPFLQVFMKGTVHLF